MFDSGTTIVVTRKKLEAGRLSKFLKGIIEDGYSKAYHYVRYILTLKGGVSTKPHGDEKVYLYLKNDIKNQIRMVLYFVS